MWAIICSKHISFLDVLFRLCLVKHEKKHLTGHDDSTHPKKRSEKTNSEWRMAEHNQELLGELQSGLKWKPRNGAVYSIMANLAAKQNNGQSKQPTCEGQSPFGQWRAIMKQTINVRQSHNHWTWPSNIFLCYFIMPCVVIHMRFSKSCSWHQEWIQGPWIKQLESSAYFFINSWNLLATQDRAGVQQQFQIFEGQYYMLIKIDNYLMRKLCTLRS